MAFVINKIKSGQRPSDIAWAIEKALRISRFTAIVTHTIKSVSIGSVRLLKPKDYCGNHPLPCPVRPFQPHRPHKRLNYLEGADWVAFNDMLNDVLDAMKVDANVASSLVIIRKGKERCVLYDAQTLGNGIDNEWVKDSHCFANRIGRKSKRSEYPQGTPGIPEWKKEFDNAKENAILFT